MQQSADTLAASFYIDPEGNERAMVIPPYECIILSDTEMTEPEYAVRYYPFLNLNDEMIFKGRVLR